MNHEHDGKRAPKNAPKSDAEILKEVHRKLYDVEHLLLEFGSVIEALDVLSEHLNCDKPSHRGIAVLIDIMDDKRKESYRAFVQMHALLREGGADHG